MARSEELNNYLANKHQGGENNLKGGLYEDFYAVYQIVSCLAKYKHELDAVTFTSQLKDTFVDDLLISHPDTNIYHQLKNTQVVRWGKTDQKGDIAFDFAHQQEDCKERAEDFILKLIYSAKNSDVELNIPDEIKEKTIAEWFPYQNDINRLLFISDDFKNALRAISSEGEEATNDNLGLIASSFLGVWKGMNKTAGVTLADIVTNVESQKYANLAIYPDIQLSEECRKIFDSIEGMQYHISGKLFHWQFGFFQGTYPWSKEVELKIISNCPKSKQDMMELLNSITI